MKLIQLSKMKIDKDFLCCLTRENNEEFKYEITSLTANNITLLYLPAGRILTYKK